MSSRFHLAIPVRSIEESKEFYCDFLGCEEGNCEEGKWQDINFWGNELTLHNAGEDELTHSHRHHVDMADVCVPHFGIHCLLYTSPSPRDVRSSRMPSSA